MSVKEDPVKMHKEANSLMDSGKYAEAKDLFIRTAELYKKAQSMVLADAPYIFLFQTNVLTPMRANVKGFVYNPMLDDMYNFEDMSKE